MEIVKKGNEILLTPCIEVNEPINDTVIQEMKQIMESNHGIGLAANQVGLNQKFFIAKFSGEFTICLNPEITSHGKEKETQDEGCLSILDEKGECIRKPKERYCVITVCYLNNSLVKITRTLKRYNARIFQHEMDHLLGRLCHD